ncbi:MAG: hypothetical protein DI607_00265, partial [Sphingomonas hengshuiensis]
EIVIVTHGGLGWFDPLSDDKGDVFSLIERLDRVGFAEGFARAAALVGFRSSSPIWHESPSPRSPVASPSERWAVRRHPWPGSYTWRYLSGQRYLPANVIAAVVSAGLLREGPRGSMWAAHVDRGGVVSGWEERGPEWRGFSSGGTKTLFRFGPPAALRLCVTEASIDAMSLAAIEGIREGTVYVSTGGGWSPQTDAALRDLAARPGVLLVAATDANAQGETFSERLRALAEAFGCMWQRLRPSAEDWNEVLKEKRRKERNEGKRGGPAASASPTSREASPGGAGP